MDYERHGIITPSTMTALRKSYERVVRTGIAGDYYEFGLMHGNTLAFSFIEAQDRGLTDMHFWGFDSFKGLPEPEGIDAGWKFFRGDYAGSKADVQENLEGSVEWSRVHLIEGFYNESLKPEIIEERGMKLARIVLVDCDLYASAVTVLDFIEPLLQTGTILIFDDWDCFDADDNRGERRAFREFLQRNLQWRAKDLFSAHEEPWAFEMEKV